MLMVIHIHSIWFMSVYIFDMKCIWVPSRKTNDTKCSRAHTNVYWENVGFQEKNKERKKKLVHFISISIIWKIELHVQHPSRPSTKNGVEKEWNKKISRRKRQKITTMKRRVYLTMTTTVQTTHNRHHWR